MVNTWQTNVDLTPYNTFRLQIKAKYFLKSEDHNEIISAITYALENNISYYLLGGGSNVLFSKDFDGLVIINQTKGMHVLEEDENSVLLKISSGEVWHDTVLKCVARNWGGIENLSLIPGSVGAAPMQNIGAYGVEIKEVLDQVECWNFETGKREFYSNQECNFGYRESIFKHALKNKVFIEQVYLRLRKHPTINTSYGAIEQMLKEMQVDKPGIRDVSEAVIRIRQSKLPDPKVLGNAGSFFKNPEIPKAAYEKLQAQYPDIPGYKMGDEIIKVPAAWLIEQCGWKGKRVGHTGNHAQQALVIVNYGGASGNEIYAHAMHVIEDVQQKFGIKLHPEVNLVE